LPLPLRRSCSWESAVSSAPTGNAGRSRSMCAVEGMNELRGTSLAVGDLCSRPGCWWCCVVLASCRPAPREGEPRGDSSRLARRRRGSRVVGLCRARARGGRDPRGDRRRAVARGLHRAARHCAGSRSDAGVRQRDDPPAQRDGGGVVGQYRVGGSAGGRGRERWLQPELRSLHLLPARSCA
jgi:hypothetical protein